MSVVRFRRCLFVCVAAASIAFVTLPAQSADLAREKEARALLAEGEKLDEATLLNEALSTFERVRKEYPDTEAGMFADFWRAQVLARMGRIKEGMEIDRALIERHPGTVLACWAQYGIAAMMGSSPQGITEMRKVRTMLPNRADLSPLDLSRVVLGEWCGRYLSGRQDALDATEFLGLDRNDPKQKAEALAIVAAHVARTQSFEKAKPILDRLISECSAEREEVEWAKVEVAIACIDGKQCAEECQLLAVGYLTPYSLLTLSEDDQAAKACLALARYYKRNRKIDEAVSILKHAVERHSNTGHGAQILYEYGSALEKQGKFEDAIKALDEMISRKPLSTYTSAAAAMIEKIRRNARTHGFSLDQLIKEADANFDPKWKEFACAPRDGSLDDPVMVARQAVALAREDKPELAFSLLDRFAAGHEITEHDLFDAKGAIGLCCLRTAINAGRFSVEGATALSPLISVRARSDNAEIRACREQLLNAVLAIASEAQWKSLPTDARADWLRWIGKVQRGLRMYREAVSTFQDISQIEGIARAKKAEAVYYIALCYRDMNYYESAHRAMREVVKVYSDTLWGRKGANDLATWESLDGRSDPSN